MDVRHGAIVITGIQGAGKTAFMTNIVVDEYRYYKRNIISNYRIKGVRNLMISFADLINIIHNNKFPEFIHDPDTGERVAFKWYYKKCVGRMPTTVDDLLNKSVIAMDEFHIAVHAYDFLKGDSRVMTGFMSQLRKRNILFLYTTQHFRKIAVEARRETYYGFQMVKKEEYEPNVFGYIYNDLINNEELKVGFIDFTKLFKSKIYDTKEVIYFGEVIKNVESTDPPNDSK